MLDALLPYAAWSLTPWEVYGLFFLLGSFAVATLSDLRTMTAQREFMEVWWVFALAIGVVQAWSVEFDPSGPLLLKWALVAGFAIASHRAVGWWLRLATADVAACTAAAILLSPLLVVVFYGLLKLLSYPAAKVLAAGRAAYPFMPVVTVAALAIVGGAVYGGVVDA